MAIPTLLSLKRERIEVSVADILSNASSSWL
jgi:hypothetical protein